MGVFEISIWNYIFTGNYMNSWDGHYLVAF